MTSHAPANQDQTGLEDTSDDEEYEWNDDSSNEEAKDEKGNNNPEAAKDPVNEIVDMTGEKTDESVNEVTEDDEEEDGTTDQNKNVNNEDQDSRKTKANGQEQDTEARHNQGTNDNDEEENKEVTRNPEADDTAGRIQDSDMEEANDQQKEKEDESVDSEDNEDESDLDDPGTHDASSIGVVRFTGVNKTKKSAATNTPKESFTTVAKKLAKDGLTENITAYCNYRFRITVAVTETEDAEQRLKLIIDEVNAFITAAIKLKIKFRLRLFSDTSKPEDTDRKSWRTKILENSTADLQKYTQGYWPKLKSFNGKYNLRINAVFDSTMSLSDFLVNIEGTWGAKNNRYIAYIKAQQISSPKRIGWLMRSSQELTKSFELIKAFGKGAEKENSNAKFGISWGTIPSPVGGYDKATSVQAIIIETNESDVEEASALLHKWYPLNPNDRTGCPYPCPMAFVPNKDHPDVKNNPEALANLSILVERQGIFNLNLRSSTTQCIKNLNIIGYVGNKATTLRQRILSIKSKTSGEALKNGKLFHSVSLALNPKTGERSYHFTYHVDVTTEAAAIVQSFPAFVHAEFYSIPEHYCFAQFIKHNHTWDPETRSGTNPTTLNITAGIKYTEDLKRDHEGTVMQIPKPAQTLTPKETRERNRMLGKDDTETVASLSKEKQYSMPNQTDQPYATSEQVTAIGDSTAPAEVDTKSVADMSGLSKSTRSSIFRAKLQKEFESKFEAQQTELQQANSISLALTKQVEEMKLLFESLQSKPRTPPTSPNPKPLANPLQNNQYSALAGESSEEHSKASTPKDDSDEEMEETDVFEAEQEDARTAIKIARSAKDRINNLFEESDSDDEAPSNASPSRIKRLVITESASDEQMDTFKTRKSPRLQKYRKVIEPSDEMDTGQDP